MERKEFINQASITLQQLDRVLGDLEHPGLDVDLAGDVLTLAFEDDTEFIINAHSAAMQIWMAAISTAWHFSWNGTTWVAQRSGDELMNTVAAEVSKKLGTSISL